MSKAIVIEIADVDLATKLDTLAAALAAVSEAHRDTMPVKCWAALSRAREALAEATMNTSSPHVRTRTLNSPRPCLPA